MLFFIVSGKNVIDLNPLGCILFVVLQMLRFSKDKVGSKTRKIAGKLKKGKELAMAMAILTFLLSKVAKVKIRQNF